MKRVIVQIEFVEDEETRTKPMMQQNLLVYPNQDGGYVFFYHSDNELNKLKLRKAKLIEVKIISESTLAFSGTSIYNNFKKLGKF